MKSKAGTLSRSEVSLQCGGQFPLKLNGSSQRPGVATSANTSRGKLRAMRKCLDEARKLDGDVSGVDEAALRRRRSKVFDARRRLPSSTPDDDDDDDDDIEDDDDDGEAGEEFEKCEIIVDVDDDRSSFRLLALILSRKRGNGREDYAGVEG